MRFINFKKGITRIILFSLEISHKNTSLTLRDWLHFWMISGFHYNTLFRGVYIDLSPSLSYKRNPTITSILELEPKPVL